MKHLLAASKSALKAQTGTIKKLEDLQAPSQSALKKEVGKCWDD